MSEETLVFPRFGYSGGEPRRFETKAELDAAGDGWTDGAGRLYKSEYFGWKPPKSEDKSLEKPPKDEAVTPPEPEGDTPDESIPDKSWTNNKLIDYAFEKYKGVVIKGNKKQLLEQIADLATAHTE